MFGSIALVHDKIVLTRRTAVTFTDSLTGGGLPRGTQGVVLARTGSRLRVRFASCEGMVDARNTRVVQRNYGVERFARRTQVASAIRAGVLLSFAAPFLFFIVEYIREHHTSHGLLPALLDGVVQGVLDALTAAIVHPLQAIVYMVVVSLVWNWAWRR